MGRIHNEKATFLGAEDVICDTTFARKVCCTIEESQMQECVGIGENGYTTEGRTNINITSNKLLVYYFDAWLGNNVVQEALLGMDVWYMRG